MNTETVESLAQAILSLTEDERSLLSEKLNTANQSTASSKQIDLEATFAKLVKQWRS